MNELYALLICTLILFIILLICHLSSRHRYYRLRHEIDEKEKAMARLHLREQEKLLRNLIISRQELHDRNEELRRQLKEIRDRSENKTDLEKMMDMLHPRLLTNEEEEQFRVGFSTLHPIFLHNLRNACPQVTKGEELFCMLIVMNLTNEDIARTLGISRSSVIKTRYRLRRKIEDPRIESLETWARSLTKEAD